MNITFLSKKFIAFGRKLQDFINHRVELFGAAYLTFGIFGAINYPGSYFMWKEVVNPHVYESLFLRLVAGFLCLLLVFKNYWPKKWQPFLPVYWYLTILYCLPFFGTFMLLKNQFSTDWLMNAVLGLFLLVLIVDWLSFLLLLVMGMSVAWIFYHLTGGVTNHPTMESGNITLALYMYLFAIGIGVLFSHNKQKVIQEKLKGMKTMGTSIAHELRTPLRSLQSSFNGIKRYLPSFMRAYKLAKEANLPVDYVRKDHYQILESILEESDSEIQYSQTIIDMLLMNVNQNKNFKDHSVEECSINHCIDNTLKRYPFNSPDQISLIHVEKGEDFQFKGNEVLLSHVLFNLIKNSLNFIGNVEDGKIYISTEIGEQYNYLYFKDTGQGIPEHLLPKLFTKFFTTTLNGTGLGLAFCKVVMEGFGGKIECESQEGVYTKFTLSFPKLP